MKKMVTMVMAMLLLVSNAFAQSLFPPLETSAATKELAPSYSVFAAVEPIGVTDDIADFAKVNSNPSYAHRYEGVSSEMYYEYGTFLAECSCRLVFQYTDEFTGNNWVQSRIRKDKIEFDIWYNPEACVLMETYPAYVECEKLEKNALDAEAAEASASANEEAQAEALDPITVGSYISFGTYEQDNNTANGQEPIEWLVLAEENGCVLVISRYGLDEQDYNEDMTPTIWETCTLRNWLNNDFLNTAFSSSEQAAIPTVTISADENPTRSIEAGNTTQDKVFLLSIKEADKYFMMDSAIQCKPTAYAEAQGASVFSSGFAWWWLRSLANEPMRAAMVSFNGEIDATGIYTYLPATVRPALWIDLELVVP